MLSLPEQGFNGVWSKACGFLFAFMLLVMISPCVATGRNVPSRDVLRVNNGMNFKFVDKFVPVSGYWYHSFVVSIPHDSFNSSIHDVILPDKTENHRRRWLDWCLTRHLNEVEGQSHLNTRLTSTNPGFAELYRADSLCQSYALTIRKVLRMAMENHALLKIQIRSINDLLPPDMANLLTTKPKRGLLDFVGSFAQSVFGVATDQQVQVIGSHVKQLAENYRSQTSIFKKTVSDLSSFSKLTSDRFDNMLKLINESSFNSIENWNHFADGLSAKQDFVMDLVRKAVELGHAMGKLSAHQEAFLQGVETLAGARLPSYLVSADTLRATMHEVSAVLPVSFSLIHTDPLHYFQKIHVSYALLDGNLIINVPFALTTHREQFTCFENQKIGQVVPDKPGAKMLLSDISAGLVIQNDFSQFFELNQFDLVHAKLKNFGAIESRVMKKVNTDFCVIALFLDKQNKIKQRCQYKIVLDDLENEVIHLGHDRFLVTGPVNYTVFCNHTVYGQVCETQCLVSLDPGCSLKTPDEVVHAVYGNGTTAMQHYTVPASLLSQFFSDDDLRLLKGDTLFSELPEIKIPSFNVFKAKTRDLISEDTKISIDMRKAAQQVKNSDVVIHSLADSIIFGNQEISQPSAWTTSVGWTLIGSLIAIGLLSAQLVYVTIRLRLLTLTLAVLQHGLRVQAQEVVGDATTSPELPKFRLAFSTASPISSQDNKDIHVQIVQSMGSFWVWLLIGILGLIILVAFSRYIFKRYFKQLRDVRIKSYLALQFAGPEGRNAVIRIQQIGALASDLVVTSDSFVSDFELEGCVFKTLSFSWPAEITDTFSGQKYSVKQKVGIKVYEGYILGCILHTRFTCKPVFIQGKTIFQARIMPGAISRCTTPVAASRKIFQPVPTAPEQFEMRNASDFV